MLCREVRILQARHIISNMVLPHEVARSDEAIGGKVTRPTHARFLAVSCLLAVMPVRADDSRAAECARIEESATRLACYDAIFRPDGAVVNQAGTTATPAAGAGPGAVPVAAGASPAQDFGLTPARKEQLATDASSKSGAVVQPPPAAPTSITARITTVAHRPTGELVVILDDGQVWVQIDTETKNRLKEGDTVTIRKASLGSFVLVTPNRVLIRVRRIQ